MATTGFWPVKGRLKEVIDYANNPDKTTAKEYLDEDLYAAIRYVENDNKTDHTAFVTGINCSKHNAYHEMIAVKRRSVSAERISPITDTKALPRARLLPRKRIRSVWKPRGKCGVRNIKWSLPPISTPITSTTIS